MKKVSLVLIFICVALILGWFFLGPKESTRLVSPWIEKGKLATNLWFPKASNVYAEENMPEISAKSAYFVDADSGEVLFQKNSHLKLPIASLTKVMTAIVCLENKAFTDQIAISDHAASMEPDHMLLIAGEKLSVEELLYGVFLVSANDGAEALAEGSLSSREEFIKQMNAKAEQLGMKDTLFINPTGLQEDEKLQYSTVYDVALMSRYLIKQFPEVVKISSTEHIVLPKTETHQDYEMYSGINLLTTYSGVLGLKTGYTPEAGLTLITLAEKNGHKIIGVILNSENRREEAKELLDYSFKKLGVQSS